MTDKTPSSLVLGTAGHIDHGKSALIKALTGTDPDRLEEEKRRGITIQLGFAKLHLPSGRSIGVVDVPGHERFVRQMVAGATGIDMALIVIAADDGIMPQTIEHLAVLELLGVTQAVIALTKIDLVDDQWVDFMKDEIREKLSQTPFADAVIVAVSSLTGEGLSDLLEAIDALASKTCRNKNNTAMRLPVDRVFTINGIGTVCTGTLWSGTVSPEDTLEILVSGNKARVRSVQIHSEAANTAQAGNRVAICLPSLTTEDIRPGDFLASPGSIVPTDRFDAQITYSDPLGLGKPLKSGIRVHVAHGTREVLARVLLFDNSEFLQPGQTALAQIRLEERLAVSNFDRFIIRSYSPARVIGGGTVLFAHPRRRTKLSDPERAFLTCLQSGDAHLIISAYLSTVSGPIVAQTVCDACSLPIDRVIEELNRFCSEKSIVLLTSESLEQGGFFTTPGALDSNQNSLDEALKAFHKGNPHMLGVSKAELRRSAAPDLDADAFNALLTYAALQGDIVIEDGIVSHHKAGEAAKSIEEETARKVFEVVKSCGNTPPEVGELAKKCGLQETLVRRALTVLEHDGLIVKVEPKRAYTADEVNKAKGIVASYLSAHGSSSASDLKAALGVSRKYALPLLEHFDHIGLTKRQGDFRILK